MKLQKLDQHIYIADQININDMNSLKCKGIQSIINNRPDNEESNQPLSEELSNCAVTFNIDYYYLPVISGDYPVNRIRELTKLLNTAKKPVVIFCRTGNRSVNLWALSQSPVLGHQHVLAKAKRIGFDI
jgi:sulfide:quinone oxidoreductase